MSERLFLLVGKSGSGKDFIVQALEEAGLAKRAVSRTTRNIRPGEPEEGVHKWKEVGDYYNDKDAGIIVADTYFNGNYYWTTVEDLKEANIYIIDEAGVDSMNDNVYSYLNCEVVYLYSPLKTRFRNMMNRGDGLCKAISRILNDRKMFPLLSKQRITDIGMTQMNVYKYLYQSMCEDQNIFSIDEENTQMNVYTYSYQSMCEDQKMFSIDEENTLMNTVWLNQIGREGNKNDNN